MPDKKVAKVDKTAVFDQGSARVTARTETTTTYTDNKGIRRIVSSSLPMNVQSGGKWVPISNELTAGSAGSLQAKGSTLAPVFAANADAAAVFTATSKGHTISFGLDGAAHSGLFHLTIPFTTIGSDHATYFGVRDNTDLTYQVLPGGVKESIVLKAVPTAKQSVFVWTVTAPGLTLLRTTAGDLAFLDGSGVVVFTMPAPIMVDSSGVEAGVSQVPYSLAKGTAGTWKLTLSPSEAWLTSPRRVYPVIIDPSTYAPSPSATVSYSDRGGQSGQSQVGWDGYAHWASEQLYDYAALFGKQLLDASLNVNTYWPTNQCLTQPTTSGAYWWANGGGKYDNNGDVLLSNGLGCDGTTSYPVSADLEYQLAQWIRNYNSGRYFKVTTHNLSIHYLSSYLWMDYKDLPSATRVTAASPTNGARTSATPIIEAVGYDPEGTGLAFK